jgi:hypothetical protein
MMALMFQLIWIINAEEINEEVFRSVGRLWSKGHRYLSLFCGIQPFAGGPGVSLSFLPG